MKAKKKTIKLILNYCETIFYLKNPAIDHVPTPPDACKAGRRREDQSTEEAVRRLGFLERSRLIFWFSHEVRLILIRVMSVSLV
jgi:hypothetical protein